VNEQERHDPFCVDPILDVEIVEDQDGGYAIVTVTGEVDICSAALLEKPLEQAADTCPSLIVDLSRVTFFGAVGLRCLLQADALLALRGRTLALVTSEDSMVTRILHVTNLEDRWPLHANVSEAVRATVLRPV
jgi:anti-sigma B factor antagonist